MSNHDVYDISIRFMLHKDLYFTSYKINERKKSLKVVIEEIFKELHTEIE